jgi:hypothetical protein
VFDFSLEIFSQAKENKFIEMVSCCQAHEEYRRTTILESTKLSKLIAQQPFLRTKNIMTELLSPEEAIDLALSFRKA